MGAGSLISSLLGIASISESRKARKEDKKSREIQQRAQRLQAGRQAVEQIRQAQVARASIIAAGEASGVGTSSAVQGGAGAVQSQAGGNVAFLQQLYTLQAQANARIEAANRAGFRSGALGQLSSMVANSDFSDFSKPQAK